MSSSLNAVFAGSSDHYRNCPAPDKPEFAFIGRSNVGKSSLINMLTGTKGLAKTSATPGKTRLINHFLVNDTWYLVDLPGYGYARASKKDQQKWDEMSRGYFLNRRNLVTSFILVDARLAPQKNDLTFIQWMGEQGLPFSIVFTKTDKLNAREKAAYRKAYETVLYQSWEALPPLFATSAEKKTGRDELLEYIRSFTG